MFCLSLKNVRTKNIVSFLKISLLSFYCQYKQKDNKRTKELFPRKKNEYPCLEFPPIIELISIGNGEFDLKYLLHSNLTEDVEPSQSFLHAIGVGQKNAIVWITRQR